MKVLLDQRIVNYLIDASEKELQVLQEVLHGWLTGPHATDSRYETVEHIHNAIACATGYRGEDEDC